MSVREEFEAWYAKNAKYVEPLDIKAWMQAAYAAGRAAGMEEAAQLCENDEYGCNDPDDMAVTIREVAK